MYPGIRCRGGARDPDRRFGRAPLGGRRVRGGPGAGEGESADDWGPLAQEIAANRMTAVAVDPAGLTADRLREAAAWLTTTGIERVAVVASGNGGARVAVGHARSGGVIDQLILVSGSMTDAELADLGEPPKLFVAAKGDAAGTEAANHMTEVAAGSWNVLLLVPGAERGLAILDGEGAGDLIDGVVARLEERRYSGRGSADTGWPGVLVLPVLTPGRVSSLASRNMGNT